MFQLGAGEASGGVSVEAEPMLSCTGLQGLPVCELRKDQTEVTGVDAVLWLRCFGGFVRDQLVGAEAEDQRMRVAAAWLAAQAFDVEPPGGVEVVAGEGKVEKGGGVWGGRHAYECVEGWVIIGG